MHMAWYLNGISYVMQISESVGSLFQPMHGGIKLYHIWQNVQEETFAVFHSIANVFPQIMALSIGNVSLQVCYHESFPVNGNFVP